MKKLFRLAVIIILVLLLIPGASDKAKEILSGRETSAQSEGSSPKTVKIPDIELPDIDLPDIRMPEIELPDISFTSEEG